MRMMLSADLHNSNQTMALFFHRFFWLHHLLVCMLYSFMCCLVESSYCWLYL